MGAFLGLTAFYLLTAPANHAISIDPYFYAPMITKEPLDAVPHPRLMLWIFAMQALWQGASLVVSDPDPFVLIGALNAVLTSLAVLLLERILRQDLGLDSRAAWLTALLFGACYGVWRYATEIEVYAAASLLSLWVVRRTFALDRGGPQGGLGPVLGLAALGGFAALMYQPLAILPGAAVPVCLALRGRLRQLPVYLALFGAIVLTGFSIGAWFGDPQGTAAVDFVLHTRELHPGVPGLKSAVSVLYGLGSDLLSANWVFGFERLQTLFRQASPGNIIDEETYAALRAGWLVWVPALTLPAIAVVAIALVRAGAGRRPRFSAHVAVVAVWFLLHGAMMTVLSPAGFEGWILAVVPLSVLAGVFLVGPAVAAGGAVWARLLVILFVVHNGLAGIAVQFSPSGDYFLARSAGILESAGAGDLIAMAGNWKLQRYLLYKSPAQVVMASEIGVGPTRQAIERTLSGGGRVFLLDDMAEPPSPVVLRDRALADGIVALAAEYTPGATRFPTGDAGWAYRLGPPVADGPDD
ncbi:MAG: hypothetical protein ACKVPY_02180 [Paracoccaceae bacterium]